MAVVHIIIALVQIILRVIAQALTAGLSLVAFALLGLGVLIGIIVASFSGVSTFAFLRRRKSRASNPGEQP